MSKKILVIYPRSAVFLKSTVIKQNKWLRKRDITVTRHQIWSMAAYLPTPAKLTMQLRLSVSVKKQSVPGFSMSLVCILTLSLIFVK